jgi:hypothetical protein
MEQRNAYILQSDLSGKYRPKNKKQDNTYPLDNSYQHPTDNCPAKIRNPRSEIRNPTSEIRNPKSKLPPRAPAKRKTLDKPDSQPTKPNTNVQ